MQFTNINTLNILLFITISLSFSLLLYLFFIRREKLKNKYFLLFNQNKYFYLKYIFLFFSLFIILFWLFEIKYGEKETKTEVNWIDLVFVLDVSKSMNALDFKDWKYSVSRLDISKSIIQKYISNNPENRYWLVIFAWEAISSSPLTTDHSTFLSLLENIDYRNLNKQWTNLERAIELWVWRLISEDRWQAIVVISDGWDKWEKIDFDYIWTLVEDKDIVSFVMWVWKKTWAKIPNGQDFWWNILYQKYKWVEVITKLNTSSLSSLASSLDWEYITLDDINDFKLFDSEFSKLNKRVIEVKGEKNKKDFGRILALLSLILFILYLFFNAKRNEK